MATSRRQTKGGSDASTSRANSTIVMRFPRERLLFAVDFIPVNSHSFRDFPDAYMPDWIDSLKRGEAMDFDVLVPVTARSAPRPTS
jgi:hypothetical protein